VTPGSGWGTMSAVGATTGQPYAATAVPRPGPRTRVLPPVGLLVVLAAAPVAAAGIDGGGAFQGFVARLHLFSYVIAVSFATVAALIAWHQPANRLGSLSLAIAAAFSLATLADRYAVLGHDRGWPGVTWVTWVAQWVFVPALWSIPTLLALHFPSGGLPSARWRPVAQLSAVGIAVGTLGWALAPYGRIDTAPQVPVDNPVGTDAGLVVFALGAALWAVAVVLSLVGLGRRVARAAGTERSQLLWLLLGTGGAMVAVAVGAVVGSEAVPSIGIGLLPAGIAIAVVRHGLWDVQLIVQRSLVYGLLAAVLGAGYVLVVWSLGSVLGREVGAPLLATALVAVAVQPLRERLQGWVSRLLYGEPEDPYVAMSRLEAELSASRARLVTAREEERRRIRQDLHDELGPTLAAIANQVERAAVDVAADPDGATARLDGVAEEVRATVRSVRALVEGLRPAALDQLGLVGAVQELARRLAAPGLSIEVVGEGPLDDLPAAVEVGAYRIVGEALTNVVRHSGASRSQVRLHRAGEHLEVVVDDDGQGLGGAPAGVGRRSMAERAAELGGRCTTGPGPDGGTRVRARLPVVAP